MLLDPVTEQFLCRTKKRKQKGKPHCTNTANGCSSTFAWASCTMTG